MHILLLILKIIGIALLVILGLVLVLILLLLFVPFCYRAEGSYYDAKPYAMARICYLFPLLKVFVRYRNETLEGKVKLLGFTVYDLFAEDKATDADSDTPKKDTAERDAAAIKKPQDESVSVQTEPGDGATADKTSAEEPEAEEQPEEKKGFFEKLRFFITSLIEKIKAFLQKLKDLKEKGLRIQEKLTYYYEIWQRDETQRAFGAAKKTLYKLWKSIRPRKGLVKFHFGTGDPGSTGQMCGYIGMLYPFVGKYVMIEPDFENKIYEGDFYFKGHITLFAFLKVAWVVLFDKDMKKLRRTLMSSDKEDAL